MGTATGIATKILTGEQVSYASAVTTDRAHEILSESLVYRENRLRSQGFGGSSLRRLRSASRESVSSRDSGGDISIEVPTTGFGRWLKHAIDGTPATTQPDAANSPTVYLHTFELGQALPAGLTLQKGLFDSAGVEVERFTYIGGKVLTWELAISVDQILQATFGLDFREVETTTALASVSYSDVTVFNFSQGTLKKDAVAVADVLDATITGTNNLKVDRYYLGSSGRKAEPIDNDYPTVDGSLTAEFSDPAIFHDPMLADTPMELVLEFVGATISDDETYLLRVTLPNVVITEGTPTVDSPEVVEQSVSFEARYDGVNPGVTVEYQTTDTTP